MNLILIEAGELTSAGDVVLSDDRAIHLQNVLHVQPGQQVRIGLLDGPRGSGTVKSIAGDTVALSCAFDTATPPRPPIDLLLALPRPKVIRRLWAQLAALGVGQIILTNAERVERNYFDTHVLTPEYYRPLLVEGLQQARDTRLPVVSIHRQFKVLIEDDLAGMVGDSRRVAADPAATAAMDSVMNGQPRQRILLAIGPEGGWNHFERNLLRAHGFDSVGMGSRTLRTDTACIALLALAHASSRG